MAYHKKRNTATKAEARAIRANTRAAVMDMDQFKDGEWFTRKEVQVAINKLPSVITLCLRGMEEENLLITRVMDHNGTLAYRAVPPQFHWLPTETILDHQPRYF